ncbi:hypothetical protein [Streptomyces sp. NRRL S-241]|uniref:hypothetical protein n=1 Tax=Streptomyces sp. NRRL S-241 TaxID=1463896 RepID=UPI0004C1FFBE|nr:hypothetical protein [Streptomyces sp. NRRL S-241]
MARQENRNMIAALLREREGYVSKGQEDRVRQVDEQLEHYGYEETPEPRTREPQGRTARASTTADAKPPAKTAASSKAKAAAAAPAGDTAAAEGGGGEAEPDAK